MSEVKASRPKTCKHEVQGDQKKAMYQVLYGGTVLCTKCEQPVTLGWVSA